MSLVAPAPRSASSFVPCPEGLHLACCVDVIDLGIVPSAFGEKPKIRIVWQVAAVHNGRRFDVRKLYTLSLHKKAALRKDLEAWRGKKFTDAEIANGFNLERLLGANCQIQVQHDAGDDGVVWANVTAIVPAPVGVAKLVPVGYTRAQDRDRRAS
jgi:hypothetical protein